MKKIINGVTYDTDKAGIITTKGDISLYRTPRSGRYFLAGKTEAWGVFAKYTGANTYGPGEGVRPLTPEQVHVWLNL